MKKYQTLLINSINPEIKGTTVERLTQVKHIFESEMLQNGFKGDKYLIQRHLQDWLQGLCSTVEIPFADYDIMQWIKAELKEQSYYPDAENRLAEYYWPHCARTLYELLYT
jgi:hypothetical protein